MTLWAGVGSGLLVSVLERLNLFYLIFQITGFVNVKVYGSTLNAWNDAKGCQNREGKHKREGVERKKNMENIKNVVKKDNITIFPNFEKILLHWSHNKLELTNNIRPPNVIKFINSYILCITKECQKSNNFGAYLEFVNRCVSTIYRVMDRQFYYKQIKQSAIIWICYLHTKCGHCFWFLKLSTKKCVSVILFAYYKW